MDHVFGIVLHNWCQGERDFQTEATWRAWVKARVVDTFAPVRPLPVKPGWDKGFRNDLRLWLKGKMGKFMKDSNTSESGIQRYPMVSYYPAQYMKPCLPGVLSVTGTPAGLVWGESPHLTWSRKCSRAGYWLSGEFQGKVWRLEAGRFSVRLFKKKENKFGFLIFMIAGISWSLLPSVYPGLSFLSSEFSFGFGFTCPLLKCKFPLRKRDHNVFCNESA